MINQSLNIDELVLIDVDENKLNGKVMDLNHCIANVSNNTSIRIGDYANCKDEFKAFENSIRTICTAIGSL